MASTKAKPLKKEAEQIVRENLLPIIEADPRSDRAIAEGADIDPSRFWRFLYKGGGITLAEIISLSEFLDIPVRALVRYRGMVGGEPRNIPALYLHDYPSTTSRPGVPENLIQFKHRWHETYDADPRAFAIDVLEPFEDLRAGDVLIISDTQGPRLPDPDEVLAPGQNPRQEIILVTVDAETFLGVYLEVDGKPAVRLPSGRTRTDYKYRGRMTKLERTS